MYYPIGNHTSQTCHPDSGPEDLPIGRAIIIGAILCQQIYLLIRSKSNTFINMPYDRETHHYVLLCNFLAAITITPLCFSEYILMVFSRRFAEDQQLSYIILTLCSGLLTMYDGASTAQSYLKKIQCQLTHSNNTFQPNKDQPLFICEGDQQAITADDSREPYALPNGGTYSKTFLRTISGKKLLNKLQITVDGQSDCNWKPCYAIKKLVTGDIKEVEDPVTHEITKAPIVTEDGWLRDMTCKWHQKWNKSYATSKPLRYKKMIWTNRQLNRYIHTDTDSIKHSDRLHFNNRPITKEELLNNIHRGYRFISLLALPAMLTSQLSSHLLRSILSPVTEYTFHIYLHMKLFYSSAWLSTTTSLGLLSCKRRPSSATGHHRAFVHMSFIFISLYAMSVAKSFLTHNTYDKEILIRLFLNRGNHQELAITSSALLTEYLNFDILSKYFREEIKKSNQFVTDDSIQYDIYPNWKTDARPCANGVKILCRAGARACAKRMRAHRR